MTDSFTYAPVAPKRTRVANLFVKREASRGVYLAPNSGNATDGTDAILVEVSGSPFSYNSNLVEVNSVRGSLDKFPSIPSGGMCGLKVKVNIGSLPSAGAKAEWDILAEACGLHSVTTSTSVVDALTTTAAATNLAVASFTSTTTSDPFTGITVGTVVNVSGSAKGVTNNNDFLVVTHGTKTFGVVNLDGTPATLVAETSGVSLTFKFGVAGALATAGSTTTATLASGYTAAADTYRYMPVVLTGDNGATGTTLTSATLTWTSSGAVLGGSSNELSVLKPGMYVRLGGTFASGTKGVYIVKSYTDSTHVVLQHVDGTAAAMADDLTPGAGATLEYGIPVITSMSQDYTAGRVATLVDVFASTLTTSTVVSIPPNVTYQPTSDTTSNLPTTSVRLQMDGVEYQMYGTTGVVDYAAPTGNGSNGIASLNFDLKGLFQGFADVSTLSVAYPTRSYPINRGGKVLLNGVQIATKSVTVKSNAKLVNPDNPNSPEGYDPGVMTERRFETSIDPLRVSAATRNFIALIRANTFYALHNRFTTPGVHTPGGSIALTVPRWSARTLSQTDDGGVQRDQSMGQTDGSDGSTLGITLW